MGKTRSIVSFISAKGGSGKTVTASSVGRFLARLGYRTLLVDTDAATNGLTLLFLPTVVRAKSSRASLDMGVFDAIGATKPRAISIEENLDLLPATYTMAQTEDVSVEQFEDTLRSAVLDRDDYDFILLDAQAGSDAYAQVSASIADQVIIVTEFDPISFQGVDRLKILFSNVLRSSNTWILYNKNLPEFATAIGEGLIIARVLPPIPWDVDVVRSFAQRKLAIDMNDPNTYTYAIAQIISRLFDDEVEFAVTKWMSSTEQAKMRPIVSRIATLEAELEKLEKEKIAVELQVRARTPLAWINRIAFPAGSLLALLLSFGALVELNIPRFALFIAMGGLAAFVLFDSIRSIWFRGDEQALLEQVRSISRRMDDIDDERKKLKVTADAVAALGRRQVNAN